MHRAEIRHLRLLAATALVISASAAQGFESARNVSSNSGKSISPSVAADGTNQVYAVWADNTDPASGATSGLFRLYFNVFTAGGPAPAQGDPIPGVTEIDENAAPRAAVDPTGTLHVVWQAKILERYDVFHTSYSPALGSWSAPVNVSSTPGDSVTPAMSIGACDPAVTGCFRINVVWSEDDSGGAPGLPEVLFSFSELAGSVGSWLTPAVNVSRSPTAPSVLPSVSVTMDGRAVVAWQETSGGTTSIYFSRLSSGVSFTTPVNLARGVVEAVNPAIAVGTDNRISVVFSTPTGQSGTQDIIYTESTNVGATFSRLLHVGDNSGQSVTPRMVNDAVGISHIAWADSTGSASAQLFDIFYAQVLPGLTAGATVVVETTGGRSLLPDITLDSEEGVHVCWQDDAPAGAPVNFDILCSYTPETRPPVTNATYSPPPVSDFCFAANPVGVTLTATDNVGVSTLIHKLDAAADTQVECSGAPSCQSTFAISGEGVHTLSFFAEDVNQNVEPRQTQKPALDQSGPVTEILIDGNRCDCGAESYKGSAQITLVGTDVGCGIAETRYSLNGGGFQAYGGPFTVTTEGSHTLQYYSVDKAGHTEMTKTKKFNVVNGLKVEIIKPRPGALYINRNETLVVLPGQTTQVGPVTVDLDDRAVALPEATVLGKPNAEVRVTSPSGSSIDQLEVFECRENCRDGGVFKRIYTDFTNRPSGYSYKFPYNPTDGAGEYVFRAVARDVSVDTLVGQSEVRMLLGDHDRVPR